MVKTEVEKKRHTVAKSSINRKPLVNLTNVVRKPNHTSSLLQSKRPGSSTVSNSSIGSTQNPNHVLADQSLSSIHPRLIPDHLVGRENHTAYAQRESKQKARSKTKANGPFYQTPVEETQSDGKIEDQGKGNPSYLNKMPNGMKKIVDERKAIDVPFSSRHTRSAKNSISTPIPHSNLEINDEGKGNVVLVQSSYSSAGNRKYDNAITMPDSLTKRNEKGNVAVSKCHTSDKETRIKGKEVSLPLCSTTLEQTKDLVKENHSSLHKTTNDENEIFVDSHCSSVDKITNKRKATDVPFDAHQTKNAKNNVDNLLSHSTLKIIDQSKEDDAAVCSSYPPTKSTNINMASIMPHFSMKGADKGKVIAVTPDCSLNNMKNKVLEVRAPLSGVHIKDGGEMVAGSTRVGLAQKDKGKALATPVIYRTRKNNDKGTSCPPLLRPMHNRNEDDDTGYIPQIKLQTEPPNKKKRCSSSKGGDEKYALPQDFVEQQRAYFKEIDDFELEVEEV